MRDSYLPLRRAVSIRGRRLRRFDRSLVVAVAGAVLLLQGATLDRIDEGAQAEPLTIARTGEVREPAFVDGRRMVATSTVAPAMLASPRDVISCAQPPVGTFAAGGSDPGCMRTTLGDASAEEPQPAVSATVPLAGMASASPVRPNDPPVIATVPSTGPDVGRDAGSGADTAIAEPARDGRSPTVTAAISDPAEPRPTVPAHRSAARDAVAPPNAAVRLKALDQVLVGRWVPRTEACNRRGRSEDCLPLTVGKASARAGTASCRFSEMVREAGRWKATASCRNESERWTAHVRLSLAGKRLTWTSERGTQDYSR